MTRHTLLTICLFLTTTFSSYSVAKAQNIYWTESDSIKRANLDGSDEVTLLSGLADPFSIAANAVTNQIFWTSTSSSASILQANIDGTNNTTLINTGLEFPMAIEVSSVHEVLYWSDFDTQATIQRSYLDGMNVLNIATIPNGLIVGIALDLVNGHIYMSNNSNASIQRMNFDGTNFFDLVTTGLQLPHDIAINLTNGKLYWTDRGLKKIVRSDLDGTNVVDVANIAGTPSSMDIDIPNEHIYFLSENAGIFTINRINFDGSGLTPIIITGDAISLTLGPEPPPDIDVPTLSQWGPIILLLMILSAGSVLIRNRTIKTT